MYTHQKYRAFPTIDLPQRQWPNRRLSQAPQWCSVDLRDGNQALVNPMSVAQKHRLFQLLVDIGFKQIEVGFPAASQPDYDFIRELIEQDLIPQDVTIQVLTQARQPLIERTFTALQGAKQAIVHLYNSTSAVQRDKVFKLDQHGVREIARQGAQWVREQIAEYPETQWQLQYSPESFSATELPYALSVCQTVLDEWQGVTQRPVILNLPATVEMSTPNVYADQIEWFCRHLPQRDQVLISVHTHNDRGCAVAAAELAMLAGADRVEGALMGNGERTGNMDLLTCAMNLYSQGIDPQLDFSDMQRVIGTVEACTEIAVPERHPYAGHLVYTAFSGSHQDAIRKCLQQPEGDGHWNVAYLPIDPADVGRDYQAVIRVNSQSGKAGAAYVVEQQLGCTLPRWLQQDFAQQVQQYSEALGQVVSSEALLQLFRQRYAVMQAETDMQYQVTQSGQCLQLQVTLTQHGQAVCYQGEGNGFLSAWVNALSQHSGMTLDIVHYDEQTMGCHTDAQAMSMVALQVAGVQYIAVALDGDTAKAALMAVWQAYGQAQQGVAVKEGRLLVAAC